MTEFKSQPRNLHLDRSNASTADLLREVCDAWDSFYDNASGWQERVDAAVYRARAHLAPELPDSDPPPAPRCTP